MSRKLKPGYLRVSSGGVRRWVKAPTTDAAFRKFLDLYQPAGLGRLVEIYGLSVDNHEHLAYADTQWLLEKMGRWSET